MDNVYEINFIIKRNNHDNEFVTYLVANNAKEARKQFDNIDCLGIRGDWESAHRFHIKAKRTKDVGPEKIGFTYRR